MHSAWGALPRDSQPAVISIRPRPQPTDGHGGTRRMERPTRYGGQMGPVPVWPIRPPYRAGLPRGCVPPWPGALVAARFVVRSLPSCPSSSAVRRAVGRCRGPGSSAPCSRPVRRPGLRRRRGAVPRSASGSGFWPCGRRPSSSSSSWAKVSLAGAFFGTALTKPAGFF